jgi:hypothetical protein
MQTDLTIAEDIRRSATGPDGYLIPYRDFDTWRDTRLPIADRLDRLAFWERVAAHSDVALLLEAAAKELRKE